MEAAEGMMTRSHSPVGDYIPMNNQRKPDVGELIRIRIQPDKKHDNLHTNGWVIIRTVECHEIEPQDMNGKDYLIKGVILNTGKPLYICLTLMSEDDGIDYRIQQGWYIVKESQQPYYDEKENERLMNQEKPNNSSLMQTILTEEEFDDIVCNQQRDISFMMKLNETIDQQHSEHLQPIELNCEGFKPRMPTIEGYMGNISPSLGDDYPYAYSQAKEHASLRDLGKHEQRKGTDLNVFMAGRALEQDINVGHKMPECLGNLLHYDAIDLLDVAKNVYANIIKSKEEINNVSPNKHSEETLRDYERKTEMISEKRVLITNKYADYIMKYVETSGLDAVKKLCIEVSAILRDIRDEVEEFRVIAAPKVGYTEETYDELKETKAPNLNTNEFRGESSLPSYVQWIHNNKELPSNLLNAKLNETLPPLVHERLCQQYPEGDRSIDDVIGFLLKTYGRTAIIEEQLKRYHNSLGSLNDLVIGGYTLNPCHCKELVTSSDEHLIGLRNIATLKHICTIYLGEITTKLWFQEYLYTHGFAGWLATNILTVSQVNQFVALTKNTGEEKVKWIIDQIEILKSKADKMVSSGIESIHDALQEGPTGL